MFTDSNIKKFLRTKKSKSVKSNYEAILTEAQALLAENNEVTPDSEEFYHELFKEKNISDAEKQTSIERVKEFINFVNGMKGDNTMPENEGIMQPEIVTEAVNEPVEVSTHETVSPNEPLTPETDTVKRGRPKNADSKRKEGFNLQLEPSLREKLNILAEYDECSATEFITNLIQQAIDTRHEDIEYMLNFKHGLRERKAQRQAKL